MKKVHRIKKGHIGIVEREQKTMSDIGVWLCATYTAQWMYLGMKRQNFSHCVTQTTHRNNLTPILIPYTMLL